MNAKLHLARRASPQANQRCVPVSSGSRDEKAFVTYLAKYRAAAFPLDQIGTSRNRVTLPLASPLKKRQFYCVSIGEIQQLPLSEKLRSMEAIWEDLRLRADQVAVPQWHKDLLDARRKAVDEGREEILEWDEVKHSLGSPPA